MGSFQFEWWDVDVIECGVRMKLEVKAKNKENAINQLKGIEKGYKGKILWETLKINRIGYQRLF